MKSKQYLYTIFHIHSSQFLILMAQKSEEIMPDPDAIIRLRRERLLGANLTGCDVNFGWMIQIPKKKKAGAMECSPPHLSAPNLTAERGPVRVYKIYASKRPESIKRDDSPFYLAVLKLFGHHGIIALFFAALRIKK